MTPSFAKMYRANILIGHAEVLSYRGYSNALREHLANLAHIRFRQLAIAVSLTHRSSFRMQAQTVLVSARASLRSQVVRMVVATLEQFRMEARAVLVTASGTPLRHAVGLIIGSGAKKEMIGPTADRVIAGVADKEAVSNGAIGQHVSQLMRFPMLPVQPETAIAVLVGRRINGPTSRITGVNLRVEVGNGILTGHSFEPPYRFEVVPPPRMLTTSRGFSLSNYTRSGTPLLAAVA